VKAISPRTAVTGVQDFADLADIGSEASADGSIDPMMPRPGEDFSRVGSGEQVRLYVRRRIFDAAAAEAIGATFPC
jgi:hypothetical protein